MSDDIALTQADLVDRLTDNLPAGYTTATYKKPNAPFNTPKNTKWLAIAVRLADTLNVTPDNYKRTFGICTVDIYYPKNSGDVAQLADFKAIKALYENQLFGNTKCWEVNMNTVGNIDSWYVVQADINFYFEGT